MSHDELSSLCDVYKTIDPEFRQRKTSYVLQTLWRDLTSEVNTVLILRKVFILHIFFRWT